MDYEETMVENEETEVEADDTLQEDLVEETDESEESLDSFFEDEEQPAEEEPEETGKQGTSEPGWIRQRIDKAVQKALAQQRDEITATIEAKYAPLQERILEMDANELVRTGKVKDLEIARELVRLRNGQPAPAEQPRESQGDGQPRQSNGQFAPKEDPATMARIDMLKHQATQIKADTGLDVIAEWNSNEEVKSKVIAGEMDFYDVAKQLQGQKQAPKRRPPSPSRSPNGVSGNEKRSFTSMTKEQFQKFERSLDEGKRYRV